MSFLYFDVFSCRQSHPSVGLYSSSTPRDSFSPDLLESGAPGGLWTYDPYTSLTPFMDPSFLAGNSTGR